MRLNLDNPSFATLAIMSGPTSAGDAETVPWILYDTQTYTDNTTVNLSFFGAAQANQDLSNIGVGNLPASTYFRPYQLVVDYIPAGFVSTAAGGVVGNIDDIGLLHVVGRGRVSMLYNNKPYGPFPLQAFRGSGGVQSTGWGTFTAEESLQVGQNIPTDQAPGGFGLFGGVTFKPNSSWGVTITWPAAVNLTADVRIRVGLVGLLSRGVS